MPRTSRAARFYSLDVGTKQRGPGRPRKHLLDLAELVEYLNIGRTTMYVLLDEGCPFYRVGSYRRFDLDAVLAWLKERTERRKRENWE